MEVILNEEQEQLLQKAAQQMGITVEQLMEAAAQQFLEQRLGKPAGKRQGKRIFTRPKPICH